jgi:hypothetical protein
MEPISGQINFYETNLHRRPGVTTPSRNIWVYTDRENVSGNYITIGFPLSLPATDINIEGVNRYFHEYIQTIVRDAALVSRLRQVDTDDGFRLENVVSDGPEENKKGVAVLDGKIVSFIAVKNYQQARPLVYAMFRRGEMNDRDLIKVIHCIEEMERSATLSGSRGEILSQAQKDIIEDIISPYVGTILKNFNNNYQEAQNCLSEAAERLTFWRVEDKANPGLENLCPAQVGRSQDFCDCLFAVTKIFVSLADLEDALRQSGEAVGSPTLIKKTILDFFEKVAKDPNYI